MFVVGVLVVMGLLDLLPGLEHVFAKDGGGAHIARFTRYEACKPELLWALGQLGTQQIFDAVLLLAVAVNAWGSLALAAPLLGWKLLSALWSLVVPRWMGRQLSTVAPDAPGRYRPWVTLVLALIGLVAAW